MLKVAEVIRDLNDTIPRDLRALGGKRARNHTISHAFEPRLLNNGLIDVEQETLDAIAFELRNIVGQRLLRSARALRPIAATLDITNLNFYSEDESSVLAKNVVLIERELGPRSNDASLIVSPTILTVMQASPRSDFARLGNSVGTLGLHEVGTFHGRKVLVDGYASDAESVLICDPNWFQFLWNDGITASKITDVTSFADDFTIMVDPAKITVIDTDLR